MGKQCGAIHSKNQMSSFRDVACQCDLMELPGKPTGFMWSRGKDNQMNSKRLDRGLANSQWLDCFLHSEETVVPASTSDHLSIVFQVLSSPQLLAKRDRQFKFENLWVHFEDYAIVIQNTWHMGVGNSLNDISAKLQH